VTALRRLPRDCSGFTLPELLVATIISFLLGAGGFLFYRSQVRSLTDQSAGLDAIEGARASLDFMANEIRTAGEKPAIAGCGANCGLLTGTATTLSIGLDANGDGNTTGTNEQIGYSYNAGSKFIQRCTGNGCSGGTQLIRNASALSFQYAFDDGTATTSTPTAAQLTGGHLVRVIITVTVEASRATTVTNVTLKSSVTLRNQASVLAALGAV